MAETSRAGVFVGAGKPLEVQEFPIPEVARGSGLVKMEMAAVCGTDVHATHNPNAPHPVIFGHENIGVLASLGADLKKDVLGRPLKEGDRAVFRPAPCGRCYNCTIGNMCRERPTYGLIPSDKPPYIQGGFSQYLYLGDEPWVLRVPDDLSTERALMAVIGNHTVMNGIDKIGGIEVGETVVVQGSGPIGMGALNQAKVMGAKRVIVIGAPAERLRLAEEMGADDTINIHEYETPEARVERVMELTGGNGPEVVVECSGGRSAVQEGLSMIRFGGRYLVVGQLTDYGESQINPSLITRKAVLLSGVVGSTYKYIIRSMEAMDTVVKAPVERLITHHFSLDEINEAFESHETLEAMVAVIRPNQ